LKIYLSSLSSFLDDGVHEWYNSHNIGVSLLGSLANDKNSIDRVLSGEIKSCENFMWDSGAISVRNNKTIITLEMYAEWVKPIIEVKHTSPMPVTIVGLDVIGDADASQHNYLELKYKYGFGNEFMPVLHYGEDISYLEFLIKEGFDYIGLGGVGAGDRLGQTGLRDWLKSLFFVNGDGRTLRYPGIKFHGFAITSEDTLAIVPLHSVDSATWVKNSAIGKILTPWGDFRVSEDPRSGYDLQHIKRAAPKTRERIVDWVESLDIPFDDVCSDKDDAKKCRYSRHVVNTNYFKWMEKNHNWEPSNVETVNIYSGLEKMGISIPKKEETKKLKLIVKLPLSVPEKEVSQIDTTTQSLAAKLTPVIAPPLKMVIQSESSQIESSQIEKSKVALSLTSLILCPHCSKPIHLDLKLS